jgi:hypothetical protein
MDVTIVGGGISGMVAALELATAGKSVVLIEKEKYLGGFALSKGRGVKFSEHSWRSFGSFYFNMRDVFRRVGVKFPSKLVDVRAEPPLPVQLPTLADLTMLSHLLRGLFVSYDDHRSWYNMNSGVSPWLRVLLGRFNKSGSDYRKIPYGTVVRIVEMMFFGPFFYISDAPISEYLIEPLEKLLLALGVVIHKNMTVKTLSPRELGSKYVIAAIPPCAYAKISAAGLYTWVPRYFATMTKQTAQTEISFRIVFTSKLEVPEAAFDLHEAPWQILMMPADVFYDALDWSVSVWNGTVTDMLARDKHGRTPQDCVPEQFRESIREQCDPLIRKYGGTVAKVTIWEEWYHGEQSRLSTDEIMPVNSIDETQYKIHAGTRIGDNIFVSGAHTGTSCGVWLMEAACESGKLAALSILGRGVRVSTHVRPRVFLFVGQICVLTGLLVYYTSKKA